MRKAFVGLLAVLALVFGFVMVAPAAQATPVGGTYSNCLGVDSGSVMARVGVYWENNGSTPVRPYQVWYDRAVAGGTSFGVKYFTNNVQRSAVTWQQTGQTAQTHNWTGLVYGPRDRTTFVDFTLVLGGWQCKGRVYSVAG